MRSVLLLLVTCVSVTLAGCASKPTIAGKWKFAVYKAGEVDDVTASIKDVMAMPTIDLLEGGDLLVQGVGSTEKGTWTLAGDKVTISPSVGAPIIGQLSANKKSIEIGGGVELVAHIIFQQMQHASSGIGREPVSLTKLRAYLGQGPAVKFFIERQMEGCTVSLEKQ